jgi:hypothetical protein
MNLINLDLEMMKLCLGLALDEKFHNFYYLSFYFIDILTIK